MIEPSKIFLEYQPILYEEMSNVEKAISELTERTWKRIKIPMSEKEEKEFDKCHGILPSEDSVMDIYHQCEIYRRDVEIGVTKEKLRDGVESNIRHFNDWLNNYIAYHRRHKSTPDKAEVRKAIEKKVNYWR